MVIIMKYLKQKLKLKLGINVTYYDMYINFTKSFDTNYFDKVEIMNDLLCALNKKFNLNIFNAELKEHDLLNELTFNFKLFNSKNMDDAINYILYYLKSAYRVSIRIDELNTIKPSEHKYYKVFINDNKTHHKSTTTAQLTD